MFKTAATFFCVLIGVAANAQLAARAENADGSADSRELEKPSTQTKTYKTDLYTIEIPANWQSSGASDAKQFYPEGASGPSGAVPVVTVAYKMYTNLLNEREPEEALALLNRDTVSATKFNVRSTVGPKIVVFGQSTWATYALVNDVPNDRGGEVVVVYGTLFQVAPIESGDCIYVTVKLVAPYDGHSEYTEAVRKIVKSIEFGG